jgi:hypothetical protein
MNALFALIYLKGTQPLHGGGRGAEDRYYRLNAPRLGRIRAPLVAVAITGLMVITLGIMSG